jgi:UDP-2,3-diacylglucosamine pyrophosphatase LpxH
VRTLVVSDLHLGTRLRHDVLTRPEPLQRLLMALDDVDRLVLLGDVVEMVQTRAALGVVVHILQSIGRRLGPEREVILVPGNHDRWLVGSWIRQVGTTLTPATPVPANATPQLQAVTSWLEPARVRVHYPGVWLTDRVWATHGHYLDRHLLPESAFGVTRGLLGRMRADRASPIDYERRRGHSITRTEALMMKAPRPVVALAENAAELARASTMPVAPRRLLRPGMASLTSALLSAQMRRASIPAIAHVAQRLGIEADWVLFGHVHRLGPLPGDLESGWRAPQGQPRIANSGSWVYEPLLVHNAVPPHPYWPGGALILEDDVDPRAVGLLDGVAPQAML